MVFVDNNSHFFETVLCTVANLQKCDLLLIYTLKNIPIIQDDYSETFNSFQRLILSMPIQTECLCLFMLLISLRDGFNTFLWYNSHLMIKEISTADTIVDQDSRSE